MQDSGSCPDGKKVEQTKDHSPSASLSSPLTSELIYPVVIVIVTDEDNDHDSFLTGIRKKHISMLRPPTKDQ